MTTLDQLSAGRAILAVGLGAVDTGLGTYGEIADRKARAELLDEGIDLVAALWSGEWKFEGARQSTPAELVEMLNWLDEHGGRRPGFDVIVEGETEPGDASPVRPWQESGTTWWLESRWQPSSPTAVLVRIEAGPPRT